MRKAGGQASNFNARNVTSDGPTQAEPTTQTQPRVENENVYPSNGRGDLKPNAGSS